MTESDPRSLSPVSATSFQDVLVIGAGAAGSLAALLLARQGLRVLLVERKWFPRRKVCGGCLNLRAVLGLQQAGLSRQMQDWNPVLLTDLELCAGRRSVSIPLEGGIALSRTNLDRHLADEAARAGAEVRFGVTASVGSATPTHREVHLQAHNINEINSREGETIRAAVVVVADGLGHPSLAREAVTRVSRRSRIGAGCELETVPRTLRRGTIHMLVGRHGYLGITQVESGRWNLAAALEAGFVKACGGLASAAFAIASENGLPDFPALRTADWTGTPALTRIEPQVSADRLFVIGDAAGYVEPFTGEGIACAIESALAIAPLADAGACLWRKELAREWGQRHRDIVRKRAWLCRSFAMLLRSPLATQLSLSLVKRWPGLACSLQRRLNRSTSPAISTAKEWWQ